MPNWCDNQINIYGSEDAICNIVTAITDKEEWMQALIPLEGRVWESLQKDERMFHPLITYYGSKWYVPKSDCYAFEIDLDHIYIHCDTAWSPITEFCQKVSARYGVDVEIQYSEPDNDFAGFKRYSNGILKDQADWSYMEGLYLLKEVEFWHEIGHQMEYLREEHTLEEVLADFDYVISKDLETIKTMYEDGNEKG